MVSHCSNPACLKPLTHLNSGRVIRTVQNEGDDSVIQHYWLCGECYRTYDFAVSSAGAVSCVRRDKPLVLQAERYLGTSAVAELFGGY